MRSRCAIGLALLLFVRSAAFSADAIDQVRAASKIPDLDIARLQRGEVVGARGPLSDFTRGIYAENCYFIKAPLSTVGETLLRWDPTKYSAMEVLLLKEHGLPATPEIFSALELNGTRKADRFLVERAKALATTEAAASGLHITSSEQQEMSQALKAGGDGDAKVTEFWRNVLRSRTEALSQGGLGAVPGFATGKTQISPRAELTRLLSLAPAIRDRFAPVLTRPPFSGPAAGGGDLLGYFEASLTRGHTNLHNGFISARRGEESWQIADCTYYTSDTYFFSLILYEIFPHESGTVVWQVDFVSAPFRSFAAGLDRIYAGKEMLKSVAETARLIRQEAERGR